MARVALNARIPGMADAGTKGYDANVPSTNPTLTVDHFSPVPLHEQVAPAIRAVGAHPAVARQGGRAS